MPYVSDAERDRVDSIELERSAPFDKGPGTLQYCIALLINGYLKDSPHNYQSYNDVMGALAGAQMEFYRRVAVPYEDKKIGENGDVYV